MQDKHIEDQSDNDKITELLKQQEYKAKTETALKKQFGIFLQLLVLTSACK